MLKLSNLFPNSHRKIAALMPLLFLGSLLAGCATSSIGAAPDISLACNTYGKGGTYDSTRDTTETSRGVKVKNNAFQKIGCDLTNGGVAAK